MKEQIKELTLLLYLTSWTEKEPYREYQKAWKGYDFDILNKLQSENMIDWIKFLLNKAVRVL